MAGAIRDRQERGTSPRASLGVKILKIWKMPSLFPVAQGTYSLSKCWFNLPDSGCLWACVSIYLSVSAWRREPLAISLMVRFSPISWNLCLFSFPLCDGFLTCYRQWDPGKLEQGSRWKLQNDLQFQPTAECLLWLSSASSPVFSISCVSLSSGSCQERTKVMLTALLAILQVCGH